MKLLVVEDELHIREGIVELLKEEGFETSEVGSVTEALSCLQSEQFDAVLCDIYLPDGEGFDVLLALSSRDSPSLIMMTALGNRALASKALEAGAYDYVSKPIRFDELIARLQRLEEKLTLRRRVSEAEESFRNRGELAVLGSSSSMQEVQHLIQKSGSSRVPVLLQGETGVGKGVVARLLHSLSDLKEQPFMRVNCAAIPTELMESEFFGHKKGAFSGADHDRKGLLPTAGRGTLFLDELVELPLSMQSKLLHVLDERCFRPVGDDKEYPFHARIIAASNYDFEQAVKEGRFREDLYFRLNVMKICIPPLRQRGDDIIPLANRLLSQICTEWSSNKTEFTPAQGLWLESQSWPGNVRELRNYLERALLLSSEDELQFPDLEDLVGSDELSLVDACHAFERRYIEHVIQNNNGDKAAAALKLGIGISTLYRKLEE